MCSLVFIFDRFSAENRCHVAIINECRQKGLEYLGPSRLTVFEPTPCLANPFWQIIIELSLLSHDRSRCQEAAEHFGKIEKVRFASLTITSVDHLERKQVIMIFQVSLKSSKFFGRIERLDAVIPFRIDRGGDQTDHQRQDQILLKPCSHCPDQKSDEQYSCKQQEQQRRGKST